MGYSKQIFGKAKQVLADRRQQAFEQADRNKGRLYRQIPQVQMLDREISSLGAKLIGAVVGGATSLETVVEQLKQRSLILQQQRQTLLEAKGYPVDYTLPQYTCSHCEDKGYLANKRCSCHEKLLKTLAYEEISSAWSKAEFTLDNFSLDYYQREPIAQTGIVPRLKMGELLEFCRGYAQDFSIHSASLLFMGGTGLGKTHLSLAIAREAINKGHGVLYSTVQGLLTKLEKERFHRDYTAEAEDSYLEMVLESDLLILDDLGTEFSTPFATASINDIINSRLVKGQPTLITTNLETSALETRYTSRLYSRLMGSYSVFKLVGKDVRIKKILG